MRVGILGMLFLNLRGGVFACYSCFGEPHSLNSGSGAGSAMGTSGFAIPRRWNQPKQLCWLDSALGGRVHTVLFLFFACFVVRIWLTRAKRLPGNRFRIPEIPRKIPKDSSLGSG